MGLSSPEIASQLGSARLQLIVQCKDVRVQRCNNCNKYWNRDVNAARNMRALYVYQRDNNGARIPAFKRPE
jgi:transposase